MSACRRSTGSLIHSFVSATAVCIVAVGPSDNTDSVCFPSVLFTLALVLHNNSEVMSRNVIYKHQNSCSFLGVSCVFYVELLVRSISD